MGVSNKLEWVLSGPAPDACQVSQDRLEGDQWVNGRRFSLRSERDFSHITEGCGWRSKGEAETGQTTGRDFLTYICLTREV